MKIPCPAPFDVFFGKKTRLHKQPAGSLEKLAIKMGKVIEKMHYYAPERFTWIDVFLAAYVAVSSV
jgi:hypothetical protein